MYLINREENNIEKISKKSFSELHYREREHLQEWISKNPSCLGEELLIIQKEFDGFSETRERLDLLALDKSGRLVIIENKLDDSGRDVTWQALKYVSYCASLSKTDIKEIYQKYLKENGENIGAEELLEEFFDGRDYEDIVLNEGVNQRIILVAANFRKEVTSTVMWLIDNNISIQCIKVTPYTLGEKHILSVEQVIPTKDAEDYIIKMSEKNQEDDISYGKKRKQNVLRLDFWNEFLNTYKNKSDLFKNVNITTSTENWISTSVGISGVNYNFMVSNNSVKVQLRFETPNKERNKELYDIFYKRKEEVNEKFGPGLDWDKRPELKHSSIGVSMNKENALKEENREEVINFMINNMEKIRYASKDIIDELM